MALFQEELEQCQKELRDARQHADVVEARLTEAQAQLRQERQRAGTAEANVERLEKELAEQGRQLSDAKKRAEAAQVAEQRATDESERAAHLEAKLGAVSEKLALEQANHKQARRLLRDTEETL